ncbi:bifunctional GTP diphosphokinase/guanosine-3',5'-bis pyrophosphate 3'-pyrophosphohydrolase [Pleionea sp. CnH1-48]|uniref:bifunctional GTP diphosphokinase/guanosine-3',5'-bis pyrophosphate 3'-pyrophosphohydrolase n=1 Tax=Pleionea sp. CnH1-48 TaxID=2954494 RepID=UPI00209699C7|nr:bifunctional GTP diphosphokinase/guanosine-3',5'-bis pyrophosphate 3'-pyrophosphohydrolase [Pleionea sp. CnH1-48]MCO7224579.1 bifunctional GTP diphosphokinase/guanosine-3',5'-bis pyrophosphate 3'-pyrophosphohydrolase [Pleionea sp. CnH1-48]
MYLFAGLKEQLGTYLDNEQVKQVEQAYVMARDAHHGQLRSSGDPYITHPVAVARILAEYHLDPQSIMAALLHDVIEDCDVSKEEIAEPFGEQVAELVEGVSKLTQIKFQTRAEAQAENFRKMMMAMVQDIRVILIKLADRLHNMRTLGSLKPEKRRRIANETLEIYAPIALRLGMYGIRSELEDLGFSALYPMRYRVLKESVKKARGNRKEIVNTIIGSIQERMDAEAIDARVVGREKDLFGIFRKMREKKASLAEVMDVYGFRVIADTEDTCYRILGILHNLYVPVPGRFKDYIAIPKANGYQSLHTTLKGPHGLHVECQIRTESMEQMAENGVAAHWLYKSGKESNPAEVRARDWMRNLMELQSRTGDSIEFIESVKVDLFPNEVFVFTPNGSIIELPLGASAVDFAYAIHTDVGNSCIACKIDRQLQPLNTPLHNGQTVEIITAPGARPNPSWLSFVITGKARANIRHYLKNLRRDEAVNLGKRLLEKTLDTTTLDDYSDELKEDIAKQTKHKTFEDVLADIGLGQMASILVAHRLEPEEEEAKKEESAEQRPLAIRGTEGLLVSYAKCCHPIPDDPIVAFVSAGRGIIIHRVECNNVSDLHKSPDKFMPVQWEADISGEFSVELRVDVFNERGVLAKVTSVIADAEANIINIDIDHQDGTTNALNFLMTVRNRLHLANIIRKVRKYSFVNKIQRSK